MLTTNPMDYCAPFSVVDINARLRKNAIGMEEARNPAGLDKLMARGYDVHDHSL